MTLSADRAVREAWRNAAAHRATTIVIGLVVLAMTAVTMLTAGRAAAAERDVLASVDEAGPRLITITVTEPDPGMAAAALERLERIDGVEWVLGLGPARDTRTLGGGRANVAVRDLLSPLPAEVRIALGRQPAPGEVIVGSDPQRALQLIYPSGTITDQGTARAVVGSFTSSGAIADLDRLALVAPEPGIEYRATLVYALATDARAVAGIVEQIVALGGVDRGNLAIQTSQELVELGEVLWGSSAGSAASSHSVR